MWTRRQFLDGVIGSACAGCALMAACTLVPVLLPPPGRSRKRRILLARLDEIPDGGSRRVRLDGKSALVFRDGEAVRVFDATCTHLGCLVNWDPKAAVFRCPCHGGVFDAEGKNISGPPPRPLAKLEVKVRAGRILVESR